jgi:hypothetical protein
MLDELKGYYATRLIALLKKGACTHDIIKEMGSSNAVKQAFALGAQIYEFRCIEFQGQKINRAFLKLKPVKTVYKHQEVDLFLEMESLKRDGQIKAFFIMAGVKKTDTGLSADMEKVSVYVVPNVY